MKSARILLIVFSLSVSLVQLIELGHGVLHAFENPIHHHKVRAFKSSVDHSLADHHFPKMKFAHEMDEPAPPDNFIALAYVFFQQLENKQFYKSAALPIHFTQVVEHSYIVHSSPPTPPPLS